MHVRYEPALLDAVLWAFMQEREANGDLRFRREYHALADAAYRVAPTTREELFHQIHRRLFRQWNLGAPIETVLSEFPGLVEHVRTLWVVQSPGPREEGADLEFPGRTAAILRILPRRFLEPGHVCRLLRHEFTHLADLLDPTFACDGKQVSAEILPTEESLVRDRYRLLWDITIDSRLIRAGRETVASEAQRRAEFEAQYHGVPAPLVEKAFRRTWDTPRQSHMQLLEMATDPGRALFGAWEGTIRSLPGSRCPLCRFPSRSFRQGPGEISTVLVDLIQRDFPEWRPELGACERCVEGYTVCQETR